jgi:sugar phosphate isomerase/epimerase
MKVDGHSEFHLTYCSNIHPGESLDETLAQLRKHAPALKQRLSPDRPFALGLRLSAQAGRDLLTGDRLEAFRGWMADEDFYVITMNGFPYGAFHGEKVKEKVYAPDWRTEERIRYTLDLAEGMSGLLPEGGEGGISTSPLSYKPWVPEGSGRELVFDECARHLARVAGELARMRERTGKCVHIDIEPEPDCLLENSAETVAFFTEHLLEEGVAYLHGVYGFEKNRAEEALREHIRICYDTCHFAVEYEEPHEAIDRLLAAGIGIGKVQISAALKTIPPEGIEDYLRWTKRLSAFAESTYLHQVVERRADGSLRRYPDLAEALERKQDPDAREWRIHFHVPVFAEAFGGLESTREDIVTSLAAIRAKGLRPQLEIETYTWDVLPEGLKGNLLDSIEREYRWTLGVLDDE